jgi:hypothetical protein
MMAQMLDTNQIEFPTAQLRIVLSDRVRRALEIRIEALEAEQIADAQKFEAIHECGTALIFRMLERQERLRQFRELLLKRRAA